MHKGVMSRQVKRVLRYYCYCQLYIFEGFLGEIRHATRYERYTPLISHEVYVYINPLIDTSCHTNGALVTRRSTYMLVLQAF
jgi:hypothetical protein